MTAANPIGAREIGLLVLVSAAGLFLRYINIDLWPLWGDEAMTLMVAQWPVKALFLHSVDPTPGLYYALHKFLLGPFVDAAQARSISLACGTLLIPAIYSLAREARIPALLSATLAALSFPLIDYSQEARSYALLLLLVVLSAFFFVRWSHNKRLGDLLLTLLLCVLAFFTHTVSVFWIGPVVIAIIWLGGWKALLPLTLSAILATPEAFQILAHRTGGFFWLMQAPPRQAADTLARALLPFWPGGIWLIPAALLIAWRCWRHRHRIALWARDNQGAAIMLVSLLIEPLFVWLIGFVANPIYMTRTILLAVPGFILGISLLLKFERRQARFAIAAIYGVSLLFTGTTRTKEQWDAIADRVGGDAVLLCQPWQAAALRHASAFEPRTYLRYRFGVAEIGRNPWQTSMFRVHVTEEDLRQAMRQAEATDPQFHPVWAIRTGELAHLSSRPTSLAEAIAICRANEEDYRPRYRPDWLL